MKSAVIIFSGGQDSTTCLVQALHQYNDVHCITFNYGQRHCAEIDAAREIVLQLGVKVHKILDITFLKELIVSSLVNGNKSDSELNMENIPDTFVPGRNILFLTIAAIYAWKVKITDLITGVCETDFSGYPDCRDKFIKTLNHAINLGMAREIHLQTPLMWLNKAQTWAMADYWNKLNLVRSKTLTCYQGVIGDGCGKCIACNLRNNGLNHYLMNKKEVMAKMKEKTGLR